MLRCGVGRGSGRLGTTLGVVRGRALIASGWWGALTGGVTCQRDAWVSRVLGVPLAGGRAQVDGGRTLYSPVRVGAIRAGGARKVVGRLFFFVRVGGLGCYPRG